MEWKDHTPNKTYVVTATLPAGLPNALAEVAGKVGLKSPTLAHYLGARFKKLPG